MQKSCKQCSNCGNDTFHVTIEEKQVNLFCSRCGFAVVVIGDAMWKPVDKETYGFRTL